MIVLMWTVAIIAALVLYFCQVYSRFSKYGVNHLQPLPLVGNMGKVVLRQEHFTKEIIKIYNLFPEDRFVGRYDLMTPILMIKDLELVKKIAVKDFECFRNHRQFFTNDAEPFFRRNLFSLRDQEWKDMRSTLSPAFTSSKIRLMVPFMVEVGQQMMRSLKLKIKNSDVDYIDIDAIDLTTRYANDIIGSCAFGVKVDSHTDEFNKFYAMGKEMANSGRKKMLLVFLLSTSFPYLVNKLKLSLFSKQSREFFKNLVLDTMKDREMRHIIRPDMIHLLMEAKKGKLKYDEKSSNDADAGFATVEESVVGKTAINRVWTDIDLVVQAVTFILAGFDAISSSMSFLLHELAINQDVQEKLAQEIKDHDVKNGGKFDYNSVNQMPYMDMVISEVLRLWPPAIALERFCNKDYNLGKVNDKAAQDYIIRKGESLNIPVWAFHRDPSYFPDPLKFDPERFSEENKQKIKPYSYIPFGVGPRNCIGSRFTLCQVKVMAYQLLQNMVISSSAKTQIPAQLAPGVFNIRIKGGNWVRLQCRD